MPIYMIFCFVGAIPRVGVEQKIQNYSISNIHWECATGVKENSNLSYLTGQLELSPTYTMHKTFYGLMVDYSKHE